MATDNTGWTIVIGARVYRHPRPSRLSRVGTVPGVSGQVEAIDGDRLDVREYDTGGLRTMLASEVRVQRGESRKARDWRLLQEMAPKPRRRRAK